MATRKARTQQSFLCWSHLKHVHFFLGSFIINRISYWLKNCSLDTCDIFIFMSVSYDGHSCCEPNFLICLFSALFCSTFDSHSSVFNVFRVLFATCYLFFESTKCYLAEHTHRTQATKKVYGKWWHLLIEIALSRFQWFTAIILCSAYTVNQQLWLITFLCDQNLFGTSRSDLIRGMHHHRHYKNWFIHLCNKITMEFNQLDNLIIWPQLIKKAFIDLCPFDHCVEIEIFNWHACSENGSLQDRSLMNKTHLPHPNIQIWILRHNWGFSAYNRTSLMNQTILLKFRSD